eukprot:TRINITY_DN123985_c0_g1_i1.p1 TRINITY_DN123985_c0_g1~~TRINITY_DN123985_c0_g1_i1.p1  ORF type:complete len:494 (+),score=11.79 TRINITY_DN123985_c0_g1_i1:140-1621(+)
MSRSPVWAASGDDEAADESRSDVSAPSTLRALVDNGNIQPFFLAAIQDCLDYVPRLSNLTQRSQAHDWIVRNIQGFDDWQDVVAEMEIPGFRSQQDKQGAWHLLRYVRNAHHMGERRADDGFLEACALYLSAAGTPVSMEDVQHHATMAQVCLFKKLLERYPHLRDVVRLAKAEGDLWNASGRSDGEPILGALIAGGTAICGRSNVQELVHLAVISNNASILEALVPHSPDFTWRDKMGRTVHDLVNDRRAGQLGVSDRIVQICEAFGQFGQELRLRESVERKLSWLLDTVSDDNQSVLNILAPSIGNGESADSMALLWRDAIQVRLRTAVSWEPCIKLLRAMSENRLRKSFVNAAQNIYEARASLTSESSCHLAELLGTMCRYVLSMRVVRSLLRDLLESGTNEDLVFYFMILLQMLSVPQPLSRHASAILLELLDVNAAVGPQGRLIVDYMRTNHERLLSVTPVERQVWAGLCKTMLQALVAQTGSAAAAG